VLYQRADERREAWPVVDESDVGAGQRDVAVHRVQKRAQSSAERLARGVNVWSHRQTITALLYLLAMRRRNQRRTIAIAVKMITEV
jgi:hypothetical protein